MLLHCSMTTTILAQRKTKMTMADDCADIPFPDPLRAIAGYRVTLPGS